MSERGKFVVVEGGVACGKSTQVRKLRGRQLSDWEFYREPGSTPFGEGVRDAVQENLQYEVHPYAALLAYSASRANLIRGAVVPEISKGKNVFLDRYWYSTYAYQGAEGVPKFLIATLSYVATGGLKPDGVLHYDLDPKLALDRAYGKTDLDRYDVKEVEFHKRVRANYHQLRRASSLVAKRWFLIDASQEVELVYQDSINALRGAGII